MILNSSFILAAVIIIVKTEYSAEASFASPVKKSIAFGWKHFPACSIITLKTAYLFGCLAAYRGSSLNLIESICTKKPSH
jgi:hypothetical protein